MASYRNGKQTIKIIGVAQGDFPMKAFLKRMSLHKIKPVKIRNTNLWPMSGGLDRPSSMEYAPVRGSLGSPG